MDEKYISKYETGEAVDQALDYGVQAKYEIETAKSTHDSLDGRFDDLQEQINQIVRAPESGGDVAAEVAQARVDANAAVFQTLKERLDNDFLNTMGGLNIALNNTNAEDICDGDADNLNNDQVYSVGFTSMTGISNFPEEKGVIITFGRNKGQRLNGDAQLFVTYTNKMLFRIYWGNVWSSWKAVADQDDISSIENAYSHYDGIINNDNVASICNNDANNLDNNVFYALGLQSEVANFPTSVGFIITFGSSDGRRNGDMQIHINNTGTIRSRMYWGDVWSSWILLLNENYIRNREQFYIVGAGANITNDTAPDICNSDFDNLPNNKIYGVGLSTTITHAPALRGRVQTIGKNPSRTNSDSQIFIDSNNVLYYRIYWGNVWSSWKTVSQSLYDNVRILALGDSICYGMRNNRRGFVGDLGLPYDNIGVSGATISTAVTNVKNIPQQLIDYSPTVSPDVIISNGGVNDYYFSAPLGTIPTTPVHNDTEANNLDKSTVLGGLQYLFYKMISLYPKAQRFFLITHKTTARASNTSQTIVDWTVTPNSAGYTQTELVEAIKTVCSIYGVQVIDVFGESMINTTFSQYKSPTPYSEDSSVTDTEFVDSDGIHPLAYGYLRGYVPFVKRALITSSLK